MSEVNHDATGGFKRTPCAQCNGSGELRIDSENINENFEVEVQVVIVECPACNGIGSVASS
jgi:DnaJ-class molecular chaperone